MDLATPNRIQQTPETALKLTLRSFGKAKVAGSTPAVGSNFVCEFG
jgi:hypothetical protein